MHVNEIGKSGEVGFAMLAFVGSLILLYSSYGISGFTALSGAGSFPMAVTALMVVTSASVLRTTMQQRQPNPGNRFFGQIMPPVVGAFCGLIAVYAVLFDSLGFLLSSAFFLLAGFKLLHRVSWVRTLLLTIFSLLAVYVVFRLVFQVILPEGIVSEGKILATIGSLLRGGDTQ